MRNIAILHYSCPPVVGGVEEVVREQAHLFHRNYHPVKVIAGSGAHFSKDFDVELNPLIGSRNPEVLDIQKDPAADSRRLEVIADKIYNYLKSTLSKFDVLIAHNVITMHFNLPLAMAIHRLADNQVIRVVSWNHDSPYFYEDHPVEIDRRAWSILRDYNPDISYIAISSSRAKEFRRLYGIKEDLTVIPNGIDPVTFFHLDHSTFRLIMENNLLEADLIFVQPSRLHPRKNIELSIKVIEALHGLGINAKLLLTGAYDPHGIDARDYCNKLENLAESLNVEKEIIIIADYTFKSGERMRADRIAMRDLYLISDLLFLPSIQEGFGLPLLEAGMIKLPIACSDIAPFKDIAGEDACFFSLDDNPGKIAENVLQFLKGMKPHGMYRNVICNYVWDNIYTHSIKPFLEGLD